MTSSHVRQAASISVFPLRFRNDNIFAWFDDSNRMLGGPSVWSVSTREVDLAHKPEPRHLSYYPALNIHSQKQETCSPTISYTRWVLQWSGVAGLVWILSVFWGVKKKVRASTCSMRQLPWEYLIVYKNSTAVETWHPAKCCCVRLDKIFKQWLYKPLTQVFYLYFV